MALRTALICAALALVPAPGISQPAPADTQIEITTLDEAHRLALAAVAAGQTDLALSLADAILAQHPQDSFAHLVRASALLQNGAAAQAAPEARRAFRLAETPRQRHEAARVAALAEARRNRYLMSQFWMRRALNYADTPTMRARSIREFGHVARAARTDLKFDLSVQPSNNVNNGSASRLNVIDGVPIVGVLSDDALALPGLVMRAGADLRYRLQADEKSQTHLTGSLHITRVRLDDKAYDIAPTAQNEDYGTTWTEVGLSHARVLGGPHIMQGELALGWAWSGGEVSHNLARAGFSFGLAVSDQSRLLLGASWQAQYDFADARADIGTRSLSLGWQTRLPGGDRLSLGVAVSRADSDNAQSRMQATALSLGYTAAKPLGPVSLAGRVSWTQSHYPDYSVAFFTVPGGRTDKRLAAELDLGVTPLEYMGFIPTVTVAAERTDSNVSRFETEELSVSVGFRSSF